MKNILNRDLIEGLKDSTNTEQVEKINNIVYELLADVVNSLSGKSTFIQSNKTVLIPVNEVYTKAMCSKSEFTYFLGVSNKEIELNSLTKKNFFKNLWKDFKRAWTVAKKKKRRKKKADNASTNFNKSVLDKYTIDSLRSEIVMEIANHVTQTTIIYEYKKFLSILGKDDFGTNVKINVYICLYDNNKNIYKIYNHKKNKFFEVNFKQRFENIDRKIESCGNGFINMIKVYNSLYAKRYDKLPNQILIESLLFACPNFLFVEDLYQTFINVSNFIRLTDASKTRSICDYNKDLFKEELVLKTNSQVDYMKLIKILDDYKV